MKKLLFSVTKKDLEITTFCSGGPGGQHQNKVATGARVVHRESGAVGEARDTRSQHANIQAAFRRMAASPEFRTWQRRKAAEIISGETIEEQVEKMVQPQNLRVERKVGKGTWEVWEDGEQEDPR